MLSAVNNYLVCYLFAVWRPVLVATGIKENSDTSITLAILKKGSFEPTLCLFQSILSSQNIVSADTSKKTFLEVTKVSSITLYFEPSLTAAQSQNCEAHICQMHHTAAWPCQNKRLCTGHFSRHGANISYLKSEVKLVQISMNARVEMSEWRPWVSGGVSLLIFLFCQCVCVPVSVSGRAVNITAETGNRKKEFNTCTQHCGPQLWQQTTQRPLRPNKRSVTTVKPPARGSDSAHTEQEAAPKANVTAQVCGGWGLGGAREH